VTLETKPFGDIIAFTRAGEGGRFNAAGQYELVPANVPRLTHDPVTLQPLGILIEEQRTNLLLNSVIAGGTSGVIGSTAALPTGWTGVPSPSGQITFVTTSLGTAGIQFQATSQRPAIGRTISVLANTVYAWHARITALTGSLTIGNAIWVVGQPAGATLTHWRNGAAVADSTPVAAGDHVAVIVTVGATAGTINPRFGPGVASPATCDCTMTMPQCEIGMPSSFIPNNTPRAADVPLVNTLSPWFNAAAGALVVEFIPAPGLVGFRNVVTMGSGAGNTLFMSMGTAGVVVGGVASTTPGLSGVPASIKSAMAYEVGQPTKYARHGELRTAPTNIPGPTVFTTLAIGRATTYLGDFYSGTISRLTYYPRVNDVQQASA